MSEVQHGLMKTYKKGCRCHLCRAANAEYQRDYQRRRAAKIRLGNEAELTKDSHGEISPKIK